MYLYNIVQQKVYCFPLLLLTFITCISFVARVKLKAEAIMPQLFVSSFRYMTVVSNRFNS